MNTFLKIVIFSLTIGLLIYSIHISQIDNTQVVNNSDYDINALMNKQINQLQKDYVCVVFDHVNNNIMVTLDENVISFDINSFSLSDSAKKKLIPLSNVLVRENTVKILGYTCNIGNDDYNSYLSLKRAEAVKYYIQNINPNLINIQAFGLGSREPIADNRTSIGRKRNRRVEIKIENHGFPDSKIQKESKVTDNDQILAFLIKYNSIVIVISLFATLIQIYDFFKRLLNRINV